MPESQKPVDPENSPLYADLSNGQELDETLSGQVQTLAWALIDDQLSDEDQKQLESLLKSDPEARSAYVECVQMHVELQAYFSEQPQEGEPSQPAAPAIPNLVLPPLASGPPAQAES